MLFLDYIQNAFETQIIYTFIKAHFEIVNEVITLNHAYIACIKSNKTIGEETRH